LPESEQAKPKEEPKEEMKMKVEPKMVITAPTPVPV
jgi:hypothetical protein